MRRCVIASVAGASFLFPAGIALAQSSIQTLEEELQEAKQQHDEETSKSLSAFFTEIDAAMASPDAPKELPLKLNHPILAVVASSTGLALVQVKTEQQQRIASVKPGIAAAL